MRRYNSIFRSAIEDGNGNVDAGYLALFWALVGWSCNNVIILALAALAIHKLVATADAGPLIQNVGIALGANATGFGAVVGAVGLFRAGDKERNHDLRDNGAADISIRARSGVRGDEVEVRRGEGSGAEGAGASPTS